MKDPKEIQDFVPDHNLIPDENDFDQDEYDDYQQSLEDLEREEG